MKIMKCGITNNDSDESNIQLDQKKTGQKSNNQIKVSLQLWLVCIPLPCYYRS